MLFNDSYKTIQARSEGTFRDKGSKFIAYACPLASESDLKEIVRDLRSAHPKANHYCWALRLSPDRSVFRVNDDGEPPGTAGRPILNTILSYDVTNVILVVVRYFGGTLLGIRGLISAYKKAAIEALNNAEVIEVTVKAVYEVRFTHAHMNEVMKIIKDEYLLIGEQSFDNLCTIKIEMKQSLQERILSRFRKIENLKLKYLGNS